MTDHEGSAFVRHIACSNPACGSSDANSLYSDGHTYCFRCAAHGKGDDTAPPVTRKRLALDLLPADTIEVRGIRARDITDETCEVFKYGTTEYEERPCQVAPYFDADGALVAQKLRFQGKKFKVLGNLDSALPFGAQCWPKTGRMIVVTEGEIDALSMSQVQGNKWPVVSIASGAGPQLRKYMAKHRDYFLGFEKVVLMFDNDEPGRQSAREAAAIIGRRAHIAELPLKDANDMLKARRVDELIKAMWNAPQYRPEGIVDMATLKEQVKTVPEIGLSYPWEFLTKMLYGIRIGQLVVLGAGVGSGKTDFFTQIAMHLTTVHRQAVGMFYLESQVTETARRLAGKYAGKTFHVPDSGWTTADIDSAWSSLMDGGKVFLYDSFGNNEWAPIREKIEYLYHAEGVQYFFIDHLTALAAWQEDERKALEEIMSEMGGLVKKLPITIFCVSHLATPEGKPHEEGGRVYARHFKGSRAIIQWMTDGLALERDQQAEDKLVRTTTTVRCLKERLTGRGLGQVGYLGYEEQTGLLYETRPPKDRDAKSHGFNNEDTPEEGVSSF